MEMPEAQVSYPGLQQTETGTQAAQEEALLPKREVFSSQDERTPGKEEEIGKDGAVWTVVGEEECRGRHQSQNTLTECQIQDAQTAFLCLVDAEMLIHVQGCAVAEARRVLGDYSSLDMSVDELKGFLALVYVRGVKGRVTWSCPAFDVLEAAQTDNPTRTAGPRGRQICSDPARRTK
ncbi:hypothetical protein CRENBAI_019949 [Crenichthys baileyi]|uniref:Uncharacterized protein n=1 Tax=Crenichthys baileyi TaxID=28760 RepID=A0AAV9QXI1_9TELE